MKILGIGIGVKKVVLLMSVTYIRVIIHDNLATFVNDKLLKIPGDWLGLLQGLLDFPLDSLAVSSFWTLEPWRSQNKSS